MNQTNSQFNKNTFYDVASLYPFGTETIYNVFSKAFTSYPNLPKLKKPSNLSVSTILTIQVCLHFSLENTWYLACIEPHLLSFQPIEDETFKLLNRRFYSPSVIAAQCFDKRTGTVQMQSVEDLINAVFQETNSSYQIQPWFIFNICQIGQKRIKANDALFLPIPTSEYRKTISDFLNFAEYSSSFLQLLQKYLGPIKPWCLNVQNLVKENPVLFIQLRTDFQTLHPKLHYQLSMFISAYLSLFSNIHVRKPNRKPNLFARQRIHFENLNKKDTISTATIITSFNTTKNSLLEYFKVVILWTSRSFFNLNKNYLFENMTFSQATENLLACMMVINMPFSDQVYDLWNPNLLSNASTYALNLVTDVDILNSIRLYSVVFYLYEKKMYNIMESPSFSDTVNLFFKIYLSMPLWAINPVTKEVVLEQKLIQQTKDAVHF
nr:hypothetical protein [Microspora sp. UTEX LB472]